jgi:hypothetical protein
VVSREQREFRVRLALKVRVVHVDSLGPLDSQDRLVQEVPVDPREELDFLEAQASLARLDRLVS